MKYTKTLLCLIVVLLGIQISARAQQQYDNFQVAVYSRAYETQKMGDTKWLKNAWNTVEQQVKVDKIYLETHRDLLIVEQKTLDKVKKFFKKKGIETAGGITLTIDEGNHFETFCYSTEEDRQKVKEIVQHTARNFDELILDDFFFTNCKCNVCIKKKGDLSWTQYRLQLMDEATREVIIKPAREVNPDIKLVIKYPNWYEHFQGLGFNLETQPEQFDALYTGTETRDPSGNQHLQQYHGYSIFRYFDNLKPGHNDGGWVDTGGSDYLDRYGEQLWITLFAKAPEITLFDIRQMQYPVKESHRAGWQDQNTSFDYEKAIAYRTGAKGKNIDQPTFAAAAGFTFEQVDEFLGELGNPVGVKSYKPYHSVGEDYLQSFLGMIGIPMDIVPEFPEEEEVILLTEQAKYDSTIVSRIKGQLKEGKSVIITSGLLDALQNRGIHDIAEIRYTDEKALVNTFRAGGEVYHTEEKMLLPQIRYLTNDSWEKISALDDTNGWPLLHAAEYSEGTLYVLAVPDNFVELYDLPQGILNEIREVCTTDQSLMIEAPGKVSMFLYDNNTFIIESFRDEVTELNIVADKQFSRIINIVDGMAIDSTARAPERGWWGRVTGEAKSVFTTELNPHSYEVFRIE